MINTILIILGVIVFILLISIRQIVQYQRGVKFTLGKYSGTMKPGWRLVFPIFQSYRKIDLRVKAVDVQKQEAITKDNISVGVNAVIYYKVVEAEKAVLEVEDFYYAISQMAQTTMRDAVGQVDLDELLSQRDRVSENIRLVIDKATDPWGIKVNSVELKDINLAEDMKRTIAKEVRPNIINRYCDANAPYCPTRLWVCSSNAREELGQSAGSCDMSAATSTSARMVRKIPMISRFLLRDGFCGFRFLFILSAMVPPTSYPVQCFGNIPASSNNII